MTILRNIHKILKNAISCSDIILYTPFYQFKKVQGVIGPQNWSFESSFRSPDKINRFLVGTSLGGNVSNG